MASLPQRQTQCGEPDAVEAAREVASAEDGGELRFAGDIRATAGAPAEQRHRVDGGGQPPRRKGDQRSEPLGRETRAKFPGLPLAPAARASCYSLFLVMAREQLAMAIRLWSAIRSGSGRWRSFSALDFSWPPLTSSRSFILPRRWTPRGCRACA